MFRQDQQIADKKQQSPRAGLRYRIYDFHLLRYCIEARFSRQFTAALTIIYFSITIFTFRVLRYSSDNEIQQLLFTLPNGVLQVTAFFCWAYFCLMLALEVTLLSLSVRLHKKAISYVISCYMTIVYTYVVHPLMIWVVAINGANKASADRQQFLLSSHLYAGYAIAVFGEAFVFAGLMVRNNLPNTNPLSAKYRGSELGFRLCSVLAYLLLVLLMDFSYSEENYFYSTFASNILLLSGTIFVLSRPPFWNKQQSSLFTSLAAVLVLDNLFAYSETNKLRNFFALQPIIVFPIVYRLVSRFSLKANDSNLFKSPVNSNSSQSSSRIDNSFELQDYIHFYLTLTEDRESAKPTTAYLRMLGLVSERISLMNGEQSDTGSRSVLTDESIKEFLKNYLKCLSSNDARISFLLLLIELKTPLPNCLVVFGLLKNLKSRLQGDLSSPFDAYHFRKLFECKLYQIYRGKIKDEESFSKTLSKVYEDYRDWEEPAGDLEGGESWQKSGQRSGTDNSDELDIFLAISDHNYYKKTLKLIKSQLKYRLAVFEYLHAEHSCKSDRVFERITQATSTRYSSTTIALFATALDLLTRFSRCTSEDCCDW